MKKLISLIGLAIMFACMAKAVRDICEFLVWEIHTIV